MKANKLWSLENLELLLSNYPSMTRSDLLKIFPQRSWSSLGQKAAKLGSQRDYIRTRKSNLSNLLDGTPEAFYWIGLLWADGCISGNTVKLSLTDEILVRKYADFINYTGAPKLTVPKNKNWSAVFTVATADNRVAPALINDFGLKPRKTYNPPDIPSHLSNDQLDALIAGFIDGDGSIFGRSPISQTLRIPNHKTWRPMLGFFQNRIYSIAGQENTSNITLNKKGYAEMKINSYLVVRSLKERFLDLNLPILDRKWDLINLKDIPFQKVVEIKKSQVVSLLSFGCKEREISDVTGISSVRVREILREVRRLA